MRVPSRTAWRAACAFLVPAAAVFAGSAFADDEPSQPPPAPSSSSSATVAPSQPPAAAPSTAAPAAPPPARVEATAAAQPPKAEPKSNAPAGEEAEGFHFGSYGRVRTATDMRGGGPQYANIVAHGSRLDSEPYAELELRNTQYPTKDLRVRVISTVAFAGDPFHYTGKFETKLALRNLFVDVRGIGLPGLTLWAGSRMYRGDDIYLLDFWPLDNLNTLGGGAILDASNSTRIQVHVGTNRLIDGSFQYQERQLPSTTGFGATSVQTLNRPRTIVSGKITQFFPHNKAAKGFKVSVHGEGHILPSGVYEQTTNTITTPVYLPSDNGFVIGAQATPYGFGDKDGFAHLFVRYSRGIAAYGDLSAPFGLDEKRKTSGANELLIAAASNVQIDRFALMTAAYLRRFDDASKADYSNNRFWEGILSLRPIVYTTQRTGVAVEGSFQYRNANVLDNWGKHRIPQVTRLSVMPFLTPWGWGSYQRPIIFLLYTASLRNSAAKALYPEGDPRSARSVEHFFGLGAEWWFNSSSYP